MIEIQTPRLKLVALTAAQLGLCVSAPNLIKETLGVSISRDVVTWAVERAIQTKLTKMDAAMVSARGEELAWYTYWLIVACDQLAGVGFVGFKGVPDSQGAVEIGYGIGASFQGQGYATEAVGGLIAWAFESPECKTVTAKTSKSNAASMRVLEKSGLHIYAEAIEGLAWRIDKGGV
jgi:ribosomal-protein-alanine N-acetyltransferase